MMDGNNNRWRSAFFITFSGNCKKALTFYQRCFGGTLQFETFNEELQGYTEMLVVSGSLVSDHIIIHGSDLVHNEGRKAGNHVSIFLSFNNKEERKKLFQKLKSDGKDVLSKNQKAQKFIELTDAFDVSWVLSVE